MSSLIVRLKEGQEPEIEADIRDIVARVKGLMGRLEARFGVGLFGGPLPIVTQLMISVEYLEAFLPREK